ncbi:MAG: hypothetical protein PHO37_08855 [Kiritimatiellae bacterium]|nr:hypothetical protein [Kiritimatiellia bacterium]
MNRKTTFILALFCAASASALQVLYTAEGDGSVATDRLTADGAQNGAFTRTYSDNTKSATTNVFVSDAYSVSGLSAFKFTITPTYLNTIDIPDSSTLGVGVHAGGVRPSGHCSGVAADVQHLQRNGRHGQSTYS